MSTIQLGNTIRLTAALLVGDVPTEPNTLQLVVTDPLGGTTTWVWGTDPEVVHDGTGLFHFDLFIGNPGTWGYAWYSNHSLNAFHAGTLVTAQAFVLQTLDDASPPNAVPFCDMQVVDSNFNIMLTGIKTDASGKATVVLDPGFYTITASKMGWSFPAMPVDLIAPTLTPPDVSVFGYALVEGWLTVPDLEAAISKEAIDRLFQDNNTSIRDGALLQSVIREAEALAESKLLRSWDLPSIKRVAFHDPAMRMQAAWIALELAT